MVRCGPLKRDRRLTAAFGALAVGSLAFAGWHIAAQETPAPDCTEISVNPQKPGSLSIAIAGDTMFGDAATELITQEGIAATLAGVTGFFDDADLGVVNLESPITTSTDTLNSGAAFSYASPPEAVQALASIGVGVLQLGNNHAMDRGATGLDDTIHFAANAGVVTVGAGENRAAAARPVLVRTEGLSVAIVSFGKNYGTAKRSSESEPGMVPFTADAMLQAERMARAAGADRVIALAHWGGNYEVTDDSQRNWSAELVAAGYDVVIGSGPHILQPIEVIDGVPVAYSIGNFVFGSYGRFERLGHPGLGVVATVTFDADGGTLAMRCLNIDNMIVGFVPRECDAEESALAAGELQGGLVWQGSIGTLTF